jgi:hypothetical protein
MAANYKRAMASVQSPYFAILEGDDYWIHPDRLARMSAFLTQHPEVSLLSNHFLELHEATKRLEQPVWIGGAEDVRYVSTETLAMGNHLGNLSAAILRTEAWERVDQRIFDIPMADWLIGLALSEQGKVGILKEPMSVYRKHAKGGWSGMTEQEQRDTLVKLIEIYNAFFKYRYHDAFDAHKKRLTGETPARQSASIKSIFNRLIRN